LTKKLESDLVENLNEIRSISSTFVVVNKYLKKSRNGRYYMNLTLSDRTGRIKAMMFDENAENILESIDVGTVCRVEGNVNEFPRDSKNFNIIINSIVGLSEGDYDLDDFIVASQRDKEELVNEVRKLIKSIESPELKKLLRSFFCDKDFAEKFYTAPAAKFHHHNYIGGLLDHTVEVLKISMTLCELFPELNRDMLCTGVMLHDIGKIHTYKYDLTHIDFSEKGKLLDHIFISSDMVKEKVNTLEIPEDISDRLLHMILSHHGDVSNGWGSTVDPKTPEAVALHYADNLNARVKDILQNGAKR